MSGGWSRDDATRKPSLDPNAVNLFDGEFARCPQPLYAELRSKCPVSRLVVGDQPILAKYEDVSFALRHPEIFSSAMDLQVGLGTQRPTIPQQVDPPAQTRYRRLLDPHFSRRKLEVLAPGLRKHANALIDAFIHDGAASSTQPSRFPCRARRSSS